MVARLSSELVASRQVLEELIAEVARHESPLTGGTKLNAGEVQRKLRQLENFNVDFGNPRANLIRLNSRLLKKFGEKLAPGLRAQLRDEYDLYYLGLPVNLRPARGTSFWRVECELLLNNPGGADPVVQSQFPQGEWQPVLAWGGRFTLSLDASAEWGLEAGSMLASRIDKLPVKLKPRVAGQNGLVGFIRLSDFSFSLGRASILAEGVGNSRAFWRIEGQDVRRAQNLQFGITFKVPQGTDMIMIEGVVQADPEFDWIVTHLQNVWAHLRKSFKTLLTTPRAKRQGSNRLLCGSGERWEIRLPSK